MSAMFPTSASPSRFEAAMLAKPSPVTPLIILSFIEADNDSDHVLIRLPTTFLEAIELAKAIFVIPCDLTSILLYTKVQGLEVAIVDTAWSQILTITEPGKLLEIHVKLISDECGVTEEEIQHGEQEEVVSTENSQTDGNSSDGERYESLPEDENQQSDSEEFIDITSDLLTENEAVPIVNATATSSEGTLHTFPKSLRIWLTLPCNKITRSITCNPRTATLQFVRAFFVRQHMSHDTLLCTLEGNQCSKNLKVDFGWRFNLVEVEGVTVEKWLEMLSEGDMDTKEERETRERRLREVGWEVFASYP